VRKSFLYPLKNRLLRVSAASAFGIACLWAEDVKKDDSDSVFKTHPQVFTLIQGWIADSDSPVATEINLDAVDKNRNQFSKDEIKQEGEWIICRESEAEGFKRYRLIETKAKHYKVEYQENSGGTLTTSSVIEFSVVKREIRRNGKLTTIRSLRVDAYSSK
jgi:hypothetical protein